MPFAPLLAPSSKARNPERSVLVPTPIGIQLLSIHGFVVFEFEKSVNRKTRITELNTGPIGPRTRSISPVGPRKDASRLHVFQLAPIGLRMSSTNTQYLQHE